MRGRAESFGIDEINAEIDRILKGSIPKKRPDD
jgi:hypothetical protein